MSKLHKTIGILAIIVAIIIGMNDCENMTCAIVFGALMAPAIFG